MSDYPLLPLSIDLETKTVLKKLNKAHQALAELKGVTGIISNQSILINTLLNTLFNSDNFFVYTILPFPIHVSHRDFKNIDTSIGLLP